MLLVCSVVLHYLQQLFNVKSFQSFFCFFLVLPLKLETMIKVDTVFIFHLLSNCFSNNNESYITIHCIIHLICIIDLWEIKS